MKTVLVIDDETRTTWAFEKFLSGDGYRALTANTAAEGIELARSESPDAVICDLRLPDMSGMDVLRRVRDLLPNAIIIIMTAYGTAQTTIEAIQHGAFDYLTKPLDLARLREVLTRAAQAQQARAHSATNDVEAPSEALPAVTLVGESPAMLDVYKLIGMLTTTRVTVLIEGESGTGKELVARAIHANSPSRAKPFTAVNCGALAESLLERELFGHERGAFTDAKEQSIGRIEATQDGALFLDEIGNTSPALQVKLLRALHEREYQRVGGTQTLPVRARIIAATNVPLDIAVREGKFRRDLYYRLKVVSVNLPPLRERRADIPLLAQHFLRRIADEMGQSVSAIDGDAMALLMACPWWGNVRELENALRRALVFSRGGVILSHHLPPEVREPVPGQEVEGTHAAFRAELAAVARRTEPGQVYRDVLALFDRAMIEYGLHAARGNQVRASRLLGISRTTLRQRMKDLGIVGPSDDDPSTDEETP